MLKEFAEKYIILPMVQGTGYNPVNTTLVALLFIGFGYLAYIVFRGYRFDRPACWKILPFVAIGSIIRAMEDHGMVHSLVFITPWIWILFLVLAITLVSIGRRIGTLTVFGIAGTALLLSIYPMHHIERLWLVLISLQASLYAIRLLEALLPWLNPYHLYFAFQMFDASTTFVGVSSGFFEQHVMARMFISSLGPAGIYALKIPVLIAAFWLINREKPDERNFLSFLVFLVAAGPGMRNLLTMMW